MHGLQWPRRPASEYTHALLRGDPASNSRPVVLECPRADILDCAERLLWRRDVVIGAGQLSVVRSGVSCAIALDGFSPARTGVKSLS
jgi:hypothetical protein